MLSLYGWNISDNNIVILSNQSIHYMKVNIFLAVLLFGIISACQKNDESGTAYYSFAGKAQKGPYITGTTINLNELNSNLGQTGKSFTTNVSMDDGSFKKILI